jgi:drug/metabolite transporter (DMT)-like permease
MTLAALALILVAAFLHAGWNLLAKRTGGGALFIWLLTVTASVVYAPLAIVWIVIEPFHMGLAAWLCVAGSAVLHLAYFISLQRGYSTGDLSLVYPLARGTGPLLAAVMAIVIYHERPSTLALVGIALVIAGVFMISGGLQAIRGRQLPRAALGYGLLTGVFIASYTLLDKYAMSFLLLAPLVYVWLSDIGRALMLSPYAWRHRQAVAAEWREHRFAVVSVAVMSPLAYILVLAAMSFTPVSYVAPAREVSILIGVILGARLLAEGQLIGRLAAALAIAAGVAALTLG